MARHRRRWPARRSITCYRLYDRDIPEVPLAVDLYEGRLHVAEYDRPHDRSPAEHADWLDLMVHTAAETMGVAASDVYLKRRRRQRGAGQYQRLGQAGAVFQVSEGGLTFEVNLSDYLDTGLFLDHRITRAMIRDEAAGKRFLNLFAYTGAFTAYAAAGGAVSTTTVDRSETYLDWARRNMARNGFTADEHRFVRAEAVRFLAEHPAAHYDLAVVDPPTFSNRKGDKYFWDVQRDYASLLTRLAELMGPGGVIYFATTFRRFKLAGHELGWAEIREITRRTVPEDFARKRPHRCWRLVIKPPGSDRIRH
jgi:23S rRNA G2069 N7-methylase RlmK/C1962 C5-methylase RlmI